MAFVCFLKKAADNLRQAVGQNARCTAPDLVGRSAGAGAITENMEITPGRTSWHHRLPGRAHYRESVLPAGAPLRNICAQEFRLDVLDAPDFQLESPRRPGRPGCPERPGRRGDPTEGR